MASYTLDEGSSSSVNNECGVPSYVEAWMELAKLRERERWQAVVIDATSMCILHELVDLRREVATLTPRFPDLRQSIFSRIDISQAFINSFFSEYKNLFSNSEEKPIVIEKKESSIGMVKNAPSIISKGTTKFDEKKLTVNPLLHQYSPSH